MKSFSVVLNPFSTLLNVISTTLKAISWLLKRLSWQLNVFICQLNAFSNHFKRLNSQPNGKKCHYLKKTAETDTQVAIFEQTSGGPTRRSASPLEK